MKFISSFYNSKKKFAETVISGSAEDNATENDIRNYIDQYCPLKYRLVNGVDSLSIAKIDTESLIDYIRDGAGAKSDRTTPVRVIHTDNKGRLTDFRQKW